MKRLLPILSIAAILLLLAAPAFAADNHACDHSGATIASLQECVNHAYHMGHITNKGVTNSLLAELAAAQAAQDRGATGAAINQLGAFINEVNAQAGKHIASEHAGHLAEHAQNVIAALSD
jgi:hypothetical protein